MSASGAGTTLCVYASKTQDSSLHIGALFTLTHTQNRLLLCVPAVAVGVVHL